MQNVKKVKYTGYIKIICIIFFMLIGGVLYSCSFKSSESNVQLATLGSEHEILTQDLPVNEESTDSKAQASSEKSTVLVYVCGEVRNPGVYELSKDSRIYEAVELAGGMNEDADRNYMNMADYVKDSQKIYIPGITESLSVTNNQQSSENYENTLININTASKSELMNLPGIGESRAQDILNYRAEVGQFNSIEDIKNISGIKEAAFKKIKDLITVR